LNERIPTCLRKRDTAIPDEPEAGQAP
jgi:hypothetical protein